MTRQAFDELVRRIEARYRDRPAALERATAGWVLLGRAGLLAWVALLLALGAGLFALGVVLPPAAGLWIIGVGVLLVVYAVAQAGLFLLIEPAPSEGHRIAPGEAPALAETLADLVRALQCRPIGEVWITDDFNAGVREVPRLGLFGWPRTVLEVGLPLLLALRPDECRAVLAHELVHLSARHGRSGGRIYRLHRTWSDVFQRMQKPPSGHVERALRAALAGFASWYWPRLHARALVLSRAHELQADRDAAGVCGPVTMAHALWRIECLNSLLAERFWPDLYQQADERAEPPDDLFEELRRAFGAPPSPDEAIRWMERALSRATGGDDTHPSFPARLHALGQPADDLRRAAFPEGADPNAAAALLGPDLGPIERALADRWRTDAIAAWRERHRRATAIARRQVAATAPLSKPAAALWESARTAAEVRGTAAAEPLLRAVLDADPEHLGASVLLGDQLLRRGEPEGERLLARVVDQADELWTPRACLALQEHYRATGQDARARDIRARLDRHEADLTEAQRERSSIGPRDRFVEHGLTDDQLQPLRARLAAQPDCARAWLARKSLRHFPQRALFVLCVRARSTGWGFGRGEREAALARRLALKVELPGQILVVSRGGPFPKVASKITALAGAEVFQSSDSPAP